MRCPGCNKEVGDDHLLVLQLTFDDHLVWDKNKVLAAVNSCRFLQYRFHRECAEGASLHYEPLTMTIDMRAWGDNMPEAERIAKAQIKEQLGEMVSIAENDGTSLMEQISKFRQRNKKMKRTNWVEVTKDGGIIQVFGLEERDDEGVSLNDIRKRFQRANP
jgi:hypothetical protein